jgi:hypothetical protein
MDGWMDGGKTCSKGLQCLGKTKNGKEFVNWHTEIQTQNLWDKKPVSVLLF